MWSTVYVYTRWSSWNPDPNTPEPDRPHHDRPTSCVIAQQYASATFVWRCFLSGKENPPRFSKKLYHFFNCVIGGLSIHLNALVCFACTGDKFSERCVLKFILPYVPEVPVQVGIEYVCDQLYMYIQVGPVEIQTPTRRNLIGRTTTALPVVLSPSSMFPPPSSDGVFFPARKIPHDFQKNFIIFLIA